MSQLSAIVTGAGSGIGKAIALRLAMDGYAVAAADRDEKNVQHTASEIVSTGGKATTAVGDVSDESGTSQIYRKAADAFGSPCLLVNCAGIISQAPFEHLTVSEFDRMFAVHVRGTFLMTKLALPAMLAARNGVIINIASQLGQIGGAELVHYSAAKAAIIGMTKALAREVSSRGVRVNAVAPGPINTAMVQALSEEWRARKAAELPLGRLGESEEVAAAVSFLASPAASLFVGQTLGPNSGDVML